jgi:hypothetical protein
VPLYVYKCPDCARIIELVRPIAERDDVVFCDQFTHRDGDLATCERQATSAMFNVAGYSAANNYSRLDTGMQPSKFAGIKTRVHGAHVDIE